MEQIIAIIRGPKIVVWIFIIGGFLTLLGVLAAALYLGYKAVVAIANYYAQEKRAIEEVSAS